MSEASNKPSAAEHAAAPEACDTLDEVDLGLINILESDLGLDQDIQNTSPFTSTEQDLGAIQLESVGQREFPKQELSTHAETIRMEDTFTSRASEVKVESPSPLHRHGHPSEAIKTHASKVKLESPSPPHHQSSNTPDGGELHNRRFHTERPGFEDISMINDESNLPYTGEDSEDELFVPENENVFSTEDISLSTKALQDLGKARRNSVLQNRAIPKNRLPGSSLKQQKLPRVNQKISSGIKKSPAKGSKRTSRPAVNSGIKGISDQAEIANYDPILAYNSVADYGEAPDIVADTKRKLFLQLLVTCPEDSDPDQNKRDKNALDRASKAFGRGMMTVSEGRFLMKGMTRTLFHHQVIGSAWMRRKEDDNNSGYFGGIIADIMGVGKTTQALALIHAHPASEEEVPYDQKARLIIVPSWMLACQWDDEILSCSEKGKLSHVQLFKSKDEKRADRVAANNVVITTYREVMKSCPWFALAELTPLKNKGKKNRGKGENGEPQEDNPEPIEDAIEAKLADGEGGVLHQITWWRIIIDEGHTIKNHMSRTSFAVNALKGKNRWALTGTPVMNRSEEYYALIRFLRASPTKTYSEFQKIFCTYNDPRCHKRLKAFNQKVMFRRTIQSKLFGRPIVYLPEPHEHDLSAHPTPQETSLMQNIRTRFREIRQDEFNDKDPRKKLKHRLHQLLRLRQFTFNPVLISKHIKQIFGVGELENIRAAIGECSTLDRSLYKEKQTKGPEQTIEDIDEECLICRDIVSDCMYIKLCGHIFCRTCIEEYLLGQHAEDSWETLCPKCKTPFDDDIDLKPRIQGHCEPSPTGNRAGGQTNGELIQNALIRKKAADANGYAPKNMPSWTWASRHGPDDNYFCMSSKMNALRNELHECNFGGSEDKKIVYVQWIEAAALIGMMLKKEGINFVYYMGEMNKNSQSQAVNIIKDRPDVNIMICGLKCGSIGLNWTWATHIIIMDLWWNKCVEHQALGRAFRIGQKRDTYLYRIPLKNSVDAKLLEMQKRKCHMIDQTMANELSVEELEEILNDPWDSTLPLVFPQ